MAIRERTGAVNVTVIIPRGLQLACEGRSAIELGVPPSSDVADIIDTLIALYPRLHDFVASEARPQRQHFWAARNGRTVLLFTSRGAPGSAP